MEQSCFAEEQVETLLKEHLAQEKKLVPGPPRDICETVVGRFTLHEAPYLINGTSTGSNNWICQNQVQERDFESDAILTIARVCSQK